MGRGMPGLVDDDGEEDGLQDAAEHVLDQRRRVGGWF